MANRSSLAGFSLAETAIVVVIIGLVMMTVFPALNAVRAANQYQLTQSNLHNLMLATAAYVQANGCLPCPANPATTNMSAFGSVGGMGAACGACTAANAEGIPPFVSLGIPAAIAHDGWGHWITMRVDPALTKAFGVAPPTAACKCSDFTVTTLPAGSNCAASQTGTVATAGCIGMSVGVANQNGLCKAGLSAAQTYITVTTPGGQTQHAAVIFVSHGKDGYGSYFAQAPYTLGNGSKLPFASNYTACGAANGAATQGFAQCNAGGTSYFYDTSAYARTADTYDDVLAYADRNMLVAMFGNSSCQTVW